jgi:hypothetical protein
MVKAEDRVTLMAKTILTDAGIRGLKSLSGQRFEKLDALVPGLRIRVTRSSKTWILRQRAGGKVRTITRGQFGNREGELSLAAARARAVDVQAEIASGKVPASRPAQTQDRRGPIVSTAIDRFMAGYCVEKELKRPEAYRWMFDKYVVPKFGDWRLDRAATGESPRAALGRRRRPAPAPALLRGCGASRAARAAGIPSGPRSRALGVPAAMPGAARCPGSGDLHRLIGLRPRRLPSALQPGPRCLFSKVARGTLNSTGTSPTVTRPRLLRIALAAGHPAHVSRWAVHRRIG